MRLVRAHAAVELGDALPNLAKALADSLIELRRTFPREEYQRVAAEKLGRSIAGS